MRMSQEEKQRSHARIVSSASRLLRERGLEGASVADVMATAGLTHGGFYKHFDSKDALLAEAIDTAFAEFASKLARADAPSAKAAYRRLYLSGEHMANAGFGCPAAALGAEIARGSGSLKRAFGLGVRRIVDLMAAACKGSAAAGRTAALREFSMMVGAMVIARASDADLADQVLAACRRSDRQAGAAGFDSTIRMR